MEDTEELDGSSVFYLNVMNHVLAQAAATVSALRKECAWVDREQAFALYVEGFVKLRGK